MDRPDCLILAYWAPNRNRERSQFFSGESREEDGWERFLRLNYIEFEGDILQSTQLASLAYLQNRGELKKTKEGLFAEPDLSFFSSWKIPLLGGLFLYQYLRKASYNVELISHARFEKEALEKCLRDRPKVIAISTTLIPNPIDIQEAVKYCRSVSNDSFILLGGITVWNHYLVDKDNLRLLAFLGADAVVIDPYGLGTLKAVIEKIRSGCRPHDVPNLLLCKGIGKYTMTPEKREVFTFSANKMRWDLIEENRVNRITFMRTVISCPFSCSFCSYPVTQGPVIHADLDIVDRELKTLAKRGIKFLLFVDDTFNVPLKRFEGLLALLGKYEFRWYAFIRCQFLNKSLVKKMKECGCSGAYLGLESVDNAILKLMNKHAVADQWRKGIELLANNDITTYASFIVGFPGENDDTAVKLGDFIDSSGLDFYNLKIFYYDHSTPIHKRAAEFGLTGRGMTWKHNTMTSVEAFAWIEKIITGVNNAAYVPLNSGEIWEIAHFEEQGFAKNRIAEIYKIFTLMMKDQLVNSNQRLANQKKLFETLIKTVAHKSDI
jgi:p-methyltransferase